LISSGRNRWLAILAGLLLAPGAALARPAAAPGEKEEPAPLEAAEAERIFLDYIGDPANLIRNCTFLGGVRVEEVSAENDLATAKIRYRIECVPEEITMPPLTRTLRESFVYRRREGHWEMLGRASEVSPRILEGSAPEGRAPTSRPPDPRAADRKAIAEKILAWAVLGKRPDGMKKPFPGGEKVARKAPVLVSRENLDGVEALALPGVQILLLSPEALLQRTALEQGGVWFRFEAFDFSEGSARVVIGLVGAVLPTPRPGADRTRLLTRLEAVFLRQERAWVLTSFQPLS
jgi:hypothetical protein